ncbi:nucleoside triphosphate pyrophosphohydrolase [Acinetobacter sp. B10A]|uniref:nucleoside triphosphate pyrophosphohydrolase n=1 Tax=Acinetobacter baretiae TaxID=2605383 RepID=UPI001B3C90BF|nr:nucleoside triphosphate pyrophosphohydrolase [Acinetobacter baretiae]MBF7686045.1 nucleoside triphosphate pyrophosphohydrolase [Acinetobacter baretiae]
MEKLKGIMQLLRKECPWDQKQTPQSLTKYAIEEAYEVEDAVRSGQVHAIKDELGDLLLQVVFQSEMYAEQGQFDFNDVVNAIIEKLIRRHPHVFDQENYDTLTAEQVKQLWDQIKQQEKQQRGETTSRLDQIKHGPALTQAQDIQENVSNIGFDFATVNDAMKKVHEEWAELDEAIMTKEPSKIEDEFGDCLFAMINVGRKLNVSSEMALLSTIQKFRQRFAFIEQTAFAQSKSIEDMTLAEMDVLWEQAKLQQK